MPYLRESTFTAAGGIEPVPVAKQIGGGDEMARRQSDAAEQVTTSIEAVHEDRTDTAEPTSSQMPSPPDSRSPTPRFNLDICPKRLYPLIPPKNYGAVFEHTMFRSSFPQRENMDFLASLGLNSILTLTTKNDPCDSYARFIGDSAIKHKTMELETNKEGATKMKSDDLCEAILFALNPNHHPVYLHCNQGRHRTGCLVACIRKIQGWSVDDVLEEYDIYASPKPRDGDMAFIKQFDPAVVHAFADKHPHMQWRSDSVLSTFDLLAGLSKAEMAFDAAHQPAEGSVVSDASDAGLMLAAPRAIDPAPPNASVLNVHTPGVHAERGVSRSITQVDGDETEHFPPTATPEPTALARVSARS